MSEKRFDFGVDIPTEITKYTKRFTDLEGFLDEDYDGEHHMLWDNQEECWIHLSDVLCLMEKEYVKIKEENEQLRKSKEELADFTSEVCAFLIVNGLDIEDGDGRKLSELIDDV